MALIGLYFLQNAMGTCAGPQDCFLVLRGVKTLAVRMEEHNRNGLEIALHDVEGTSEQRILAFSEVVKRALSAGAGGALGKLGLLVDCAVAGNKARALNPRVNWNQAPSHAAVGVAE